MIESKEVKTIKVGSYVSSTMESVTGGRLFIEGRVMSIEFNIATIRTPHLGIQRENLVHLKLDQP